MRYKLFRGSIHINTIEADEAFIKRYCDKYSYTYEPEVLPVPDPVPTEAERITALEEQMTQSDETAIALFESQASLEEQLAQSDETNIALFEALAAQEEVNTAQDDALIEIFEMIGGLQ